MRTKMHHQTLRPPACLLLALVMFSCRSNLQEEFTVLSGEFRQSITESGELESVNATYISIPRTSSRYGYYYKITGLIEHGEKVHKGDSVAAIDASGIYKFLIEKEEDLEQEKAAANKKKVEMENSYQELNAKLKSEQAAYELKKLELERSRYEPETRS